MRLRTKILLPTIALIALPIVAIVLSIRGQFEHIREERLGGLSGTARGIQDSIDRFLFERYGDVQAFAMNQAVQRDLGSLDASARTRLTEVINGYVTGYGCYALSIVVDTTGRLAVVNGVDGRGQALSASQSLVGRDLSGADWFRLVRDGRFTTHNGEGSLTGTVVTAPERNPLVAEVYMDRAPSWTMNFAAPIKDISGRVVGYWCNVFEPAVLEVVVGQQYEQLKRADLASAEITVLDSSGRILIDIDPSLHGSSANVRDDVLKANLAQAGVDLASRGISASNPADGIGGSRHKRKSEKLGRDYMQEGAYARSTPTLGFAGSGFVTLVRVETAEIFDLINTLLTTSIITGLISVVVAAGVMIWFAGSIAKLVQRAAKAINSLASGDISQTLQISGRDEVAELAAAYNTARDGLQNAFGSDRIDWQNLAAQRAEAGRMRNVVENAPINIMVADRDFVIRYVNPASLETLHKIEHLLPVKASQIVGQSVDIFHKNPAHQRKILNDPKNLPHLAQFALGPEVMQLQAAAIRDLDGNYVGPMVTWAIVTEKVEMERREKETSASTRRTLDAVGQHSQTVSAASEELSATARQMSESSNDAAQQADSVAAACEQVARNVGTVATSAEEMNASIKEIARNSAEAARVATAAVKVTNDTNTTVSKLGVSSNEIGVVIKVITSIAEQTNLLALNATIEAARAGEAGKGFAVVANEVKELAKQTAAATEDISRKIEAIQTDTHGAVSAISEISKIIGQINDIQNTIASAVEEQSATTNEIARNAAEASKGSTDITRSITAVSQGAKATHQGAGNTLSAAQELAKLAADLRSIVEHGAAKSVPAAEISADGNGQAGAKSLARNRLADQPNYF